MFLAEKTTTINVLIKNQATVETGGVVKARSDTGVGTMKAALTILAAGAVASSVEAKDHSSSKPLEGMTTEDLRRSTSEFVAANADKIKPIARQRLLRKTSKKRDRKRSKYDDDDDDDDDNDWWGGGNWHGGFENMWDDWHGGRSKSGKFRYSGRSKGGKARYGDDWYNDDWHGGRDDVSTCM